MKYNVARIPFRAWCADCVIGNRKSDKHSTSKDRDENKVPIVGVDYAFLDKTYENGQLREEMTVLVAKGRTSGCIFGVPVPQK